METFIFKAQWLGSNLSTTKTQLLTWMVFIFFMLFTFYFVQVHSENKIFFSIFCYDGGEIRKTKNNFDFLYHL
jgi:hypothetical protein